MRFHVLGLPHTQTTKEYDWCAYTGKIRKFASMMHDAGHEVFLYSSEDNEARCTEHISCITKKEQKKYNSGRFGNFDAENVLWKTMNRRALGGIASRLEDKDFICITAGTCQKRISDAFPEITSVEIGIGYSGVYADYRVFESYAWMHTLYGSSLGTHEADGRFYDAVIPNFFDVDDFEVGEEEDYFLYLGRLIDRKGVQIAADTCEHLDARLIFAGEGPNIPSYGEKVGLVGVEKRKELLSHAKALFVPTTYVEPFGGVAVEAMLSGVPVITTDWGAFTETVVDGKYGSRCRTMQEFVDAAKNYKNLTRGQELSDYAKSRWSTQSVTPMYEKYFNRLLGLWGEGWSAVV